MSKLDKAHRDYEVLNSFSLGNNWGDMETPQHGNASKKNKIIKLIYCRLLST